MSKEEFLKRFPQYVDGIIVFSSDREKLGTVLALRESDLIIEEGFFFPVDCIVPYDQVEKVKDGEMVLRRHSLEMLREVSEEEVAADIPRKSVTVRGEEQDKQPSLGDRVA